jgi:hypothetical protein
MDKGRQQAPHGFHASLIMLCQRSELYDDIYVDWLNRARYPCGVVAKQTALLAHPGPTRQDGERDIIGKMVGDPLVRCPESVTRA